MLVVPGADGRFDLVEDDGHGAVVRTPIRYDDDAGTLTIGPADGAVACLPQARTWTATFPGGVPGAAVRAAPGEQVTVRPGPAPRVDTGRDLFRRLDVARIEHHLKVTALRICTADRPTGHRLGDLHALGLPRAVESALIEVLTAEAT